MSELQPCAPDIFANGVAVAVVHSVGAANIESWVRAVRGWARVEKVDWHYIGGRGRVVVLGTPAEVGRVHDACDRLLPALNAIFHERYGERAGVAGEVFDLDFIISTLIVE